MDVERFPGLRSTGLGSCWMRESHEKSWMVTGVLAWASGLWDATGQDGEGGEGGRGSRKFVETGRGADYNLNSSEVRGVNHPCSQKFTYNL